MHSDTTPQMVQRIRLTAGQIFSRLLPETLPLQADFRHCPEPVPFAGRLSGNYKPIAEGTSWGSGSDSAWFHLRGNIPEAWAGSPVIAWLDIGTEGLVHRPDGTALQGISAGSVFDNTVWRGNRSFVHLLDSCRGGETIDLWLEGACLSHPGEEVFDEPVPMPQPVKGFPNGLVNRLRLARFDQRIWDLWMDVDVLLSLYRGLSNSPRRSKVLAALDRACSAFHREGPAAARTELAAVLAQPANASDLEVTAIGHAHLDTAWLWRLRDGRRKFVRTCTNQLRLMERYPEHVFGASSALHYRWLAEDQPLLLERIRSRMATGHWEVLGAMWVEPDCNMPCGESYIRQCLYGRRAFKEMLGVAPDHAWLPDVFGFNGNIPQILAHCGVDGLFTQKLSWGEPDRLPCQSFVWEGIDGTGIPVHFPPEDAYSVNLDPESLIKGQNRYTERDRLDAMLSMFGCGDGGGGPTEKHLERARRIRNLEGCPKVRLGTASSFLEILRRERRKLPVWRGELYVEAHRGTLTTQARIKAANRRCEQALLGFEILCSIEGPSACPQNQLDSWWEETLLLQFHDILPGTAIAEVNHETHMAHDRILNEINRAAQDFATRNFPTQSDSILLFNSLSTPWQGVLPLPWPVSTDDGTALNSQQDGEKAVTSVNIPPLSFLSLRRSGKAVESKPLSESVLENEWVRYEFNTAGLLLRGFDKRHGRELIPAERPANALVLYHDHAPQWDAWDIHPTYVNEAIPGAVSLSFAGGNSGPVKQRLVFSGQAGTSPIRQEISLAANSALLEIHTTVDWREEHRMLRVEFPLLVQADQAGFDIPFGTMRRGTHRNTSWDEAKFEVLAHRFVDLSEPDFGIALLNDGKYGHSAHRDVLAITLLRSPVFPDAGADRHTHTFTYALLPHGGLTCDPALLQAAAALNRAPLLWRDRGIPARQVPVRLESNTVQLESITRSEEGTDWIVRVAEHTGRHGRGTLHGKGVFTPCNAEGKAIGPASSAPLQLDLRPLGIASWRFSGI